MSASDEDLRRILNVKLATEQAVRDPDVEPSDLIQASLMA